MDARVALPRAAPPEVRLAAALIVVPDCVKLPEPHGRELTSVVPARSMHAGDALALTVDTVEPASVVDGVRVSVFPLADELNALALCVAVAEFVALEAVLGSLSAEDAAETLPDDWSVPVVISRVAPVVFAVPRALEVCSMGVEDWSCTPVSWACLKSMPAMGLPLYPLPGPTVIVGVSDVAVACRNGWQGAENG
jgi:hypothetical protein